MSKAINDTDRYTVTTSAIQDLVGKVKAEDAKKVDIQNVSLESQATTILAQVQAMAASNIHYRRFYTTSDGGSANISDKPTSSNAGFMCEAYCNRRASASDWRYVVLCYVKETRPYIAWVTNSTTAISWNTLDTHYTTHLYAGSGAAANAATTNGNTKLTAVDNSTVRNTVTIQGSNNVSVSSDANGVITIDGTHNHDAVYMKATAGTKNLASNTETTIGTVNGSDVKLKMPVIPGASSTTPIVDGTASKGSESSWARGDHVHPTDTSREAASNKKTTLNSTSDTDFPTSKAVATFVNSSIATATANFLGTYDVVADLGLTTSATNAQIATALGSHTWPSGVTPTNNDYVFVSVDDPGTTTASAEYRRFKYDGSAWSYEYTLNNSSFTQAQWDAINSGVTASFVTNAVTGVKGSSESSYRTGQVNITKSNIGLGSVVNTGDSATPVSGGTTKFTTGGAYTELGKKVSKSGDTMTGQLINTTGEADSIKVSHGVANTNANVLAERTDTGVGVYMGVGSGGSNHGVYSKKNANWIIRADTSGNVIINDGKASNKVAIGNSNLGTTTKPIYLASGVPTEGSTYAGGTAVTLNGTSAAASTASFYAPTGAGTSNYVLKSNGSGAPTWVEKAPKASAADTATHRAEQGYTCLWSNGQYVSTKPYALLAGKTVPTTVNWGFGQLFKLEVQDRYIIFKINLAGTRSAVSSGTTVYVLHGMGWTKADLNKALIVTYEYTANATCTVRIYSDLSLTSSHWQRVSLRQLDNHAGDQLAYNDWDVFTFYKNTDNSNMVASVTGTVMTNAFEAGQFFGNATSASKATNDSDGNAINATYFKSSGNVTLVSGTATKIGTQNGTDVKLTLPTIPAAANNGALQLQLNGGTATSKFTANQSGNSTLAFSTGSTAGTFKVDSTEIAIAGFTKVESSSTNGNIKINGTETTVYTHPTTAGNKHIPSGGSSGQFLGYDSAGTAKWVNNPNTDTKQNITLATTTKAFITGVSTTPTGTVQALTGLADTGVYLTTTAGELNATQYKVNEHCTMKYNSTKSSLDFTFS